MIGDKTAPTSSHRHIVGTLFDAQHLLVEADRADDTVGHRRGNAGESAFDPMREHYPAAALFALISTLLRDEQERDGLGLSGELALRIAPLEQPGKFAKVSACCNVGK